MGKTHVYLCTSRNTMPVTSKRFNIYLLHWIKMVSWCIWATSQLKKHLRGDGLKIWGTFFFFGTSRFPVFKRNMDTVQCRISELSRSVLRQQCQERYPLCKIYLKWKPLCTRVQMKVCSFLYCLCQWKMSTNRGLTK